MKTVILAGGLGTRLREETEFKPKPMVPIGDKPIIWHIMQTYSKFDFKDFIICAGYKGEIISEYFYNFVPNNYDFNVEIGINNKIQTFGQINELGWKVTVAKTGSYTNTGGRIHKVKKYLNNETFMCTYGDGVANINITDLLKFHKSHGKIATLSAVNPVSRFGVLETGDNFEVLSFEEKPISEGRINAGYFVFEPEIFNYIGENSVLESEVLARLALDKQLIMYEHDGFWQAMDTYREALLLNDLWKNDKAPWKV